MLFQENKRKLLESILFLENNPISESELEQMLDINNQELKSILYELQSSLSERDSALDIEYLEDRIYLKPKKEYMDFLFQIYGKKDKKRFTRASLEVLSIVAWKQPITRSEIEEIRGVDSSNSVKTLMERGFLKILGKKEVLGRPQTFGTTEKFLKYFDFASLDELPKIDDLKELFQ